MRRSRYLTGEEVQEIRRLRRRKCSVDDLAAKFHVSRQAICNAASGKTHYRVPGPVTPFTIKCRGKLSPDDVVRVRKLYRNGYSIRDIARRYGKWWVQIRNAISGRTRRHLPGAIDPFGLVADAIAAAPPKTACELCNGTQRLRLVQQMVGRGRACKGFEPARWWCLKCCKANMGHYRLLVQHDQPRRNWRARKAIGQAKSAGGDRRRSTAPT
jgi:hypothetical protein